MSRARINGNGNDTLLIIGALIGGYLLIGKSLGSLFGSNPAATQAVSQQAQTTPGSNPFSYLYQPLQNVFLTNPPRDAAGNAYTLQSYVKYLAQLYLANNTAPTGNAQVDGAI